MTSLRNLFEDPPPAFVFEVAPTHVAMAHAASDAQAIVEPLAPGAVRPSPVNDNIIDTEAFAAAVKNLVVHAGPSRKTRRAALILPDHSARVSVLDFDQFPEKPQDQLPLLHFRIKKTLPYDIDSAAISHFVQPMTKEGRREIVAAITPLEVVARYEAPFRAANFHVGIVTVSHLATLNLVGQTGVSVVAKMSSGVLTVMALDHGILRLVRSLEMSTVTLDEIAADLYPTFAYAEDNFGAHPDSLVLCGFGDLVDAASDRFSQELSCKVERLPFKNAGLAGYLYSRKIQGVAA